MLNVVESLKKQTESPQLVCHNYIRPHLSWDLLIPDQSYQVEGEPKRKWKICYSTNQVVVERENKNWK